MTLRKADYLFFSIKIRLIRISKKEYQTLHDLIAELREQNHILLNQVAALEQEVSSLKEEIRLLKNGKNSNTSSTPPSHDFGRSNKKSLREPSEKKQGGQKGHEGTTLQMSEHPDETIEYRPSVCVHCGEILAAEESKFAYRKQEIVIPPIIPKYIEHQSYSCTCKNCGKTTKSETPDHLRANIQYSSDIKALVAYLSVRQYMPYERIAEFVKDLLNLPISEGTIDNFVKDMARKSEPVYEIIRQKVESSDVVGGDETGIKINKKKGWLWTFQTDTLTFLAASESRGFQTINDLFKNGFPYSVYVTDCWAAQLKVKTKAKQLCTAHLMRETNNFIDAIDCSWSKEMKQLLKESIAFKKQMHKSDYFRENSERDRFRDRLNDLLDSDYTGKHQKIKAFIERLRKNRDSILTFLYYLKVPPDNNGSERAIRNAKVKMKVSCQFRSLSGAKCFAILRTVIDTTIKNAQNVLNALTNIAAMVYAAE